MSQGTAEIKKLVVLPEDDVTAIEIHQRFSRYEGSEHIANRSTLRWFAALMRIFRPATILELGAGIGTMTEMMLMERYGAKKSFHNRVERVLPKRSSEKPIKT